jgi:hypothetical protein
MERVRESNPRGYSVLKRDSDVICHKSYLLTTRFPSGHGRIFRSAFGQLPLQAIRLYPRLLRLNEGRLHRPCPS